MERELELENASLKTQILLARKSAHTTQLRHEEEILKLIKAQNSKLAAIKNKEEKNVWGTLKMPIPSMTELIGFVFFAMIFLVLIIPILWMLGVIPEPTCVVGHC